MDYNNYFKNYVNSISHLLAEVDTNLINQSVELIKKRTSSNSTIFLIGNGGSSSISSHVSVDFVKSAKIKSLTFNNANLITCFANDFGYENWVKEAIKAFCTIDDILILISSSGKSKNIVNAANSIIEKNQSKISKDVWTKNEEGELISVKKAFSDNEEGRMISNLIFEEKNRKQLTNSNFAVLYRTNSQSRSMEEALRRIGIKYKVFGGVSFYQRKEVKDLLAYLRFVVNHNDEQSFRRINNYPRRGIGLISIDKIILTSNEENKSLWEILKNASNYFNRRVLKSLIPFVDMIRSFEIFNNNNNAYVIASHIASTSGLLEDLYNDKSIEGISRFENIQELKDYNSKETFWSVRIIIIIIVPLLRL